MIEHRYLTIDVIESCNLHTNLDCACCISRTSKVRQLSISQNFVAASLLFTVLHCLRVLFANIVIFSVINCNSLPVILFRDLTSLQNCNHLNSGIFSVTGTIQLRNVLYILLVPLLAFVHMRSHIFIYEPLPPMPSHRHVGLFNQLSIS